MTATLITASDNHDDINVFARCRCVDPGTGARLGRRCPLLGQPGHGSWYFAAELPALAGKRQRLRRGGYPTCTLAVQARDALLAEPTGLAAGQAWTLERWLNRWLLDMRDCLRPTTVDGYRKHAQLHLIPMLGHVKLAEISTRQVQTMLRRLATRRTHDGGPIAAGTVARILATLRSGCPPRSAKD
jgi:hypothetical protein